MKARVIVLIICFFFVGLAITFLFGFWAFFAHTTFLHLVLFAILVFLKALLEGFLFLFLHKSNLVLVEKAFYFACSISVICNSSSSSALFNFFPIFLKLYLLLFVYLLLVNMLSVLLGFSFRGVANLGENRLGKIQSKFNLGIIKMMLGNNTFILWKWINSDTIVWWILIVCIWLIFSLEGICLIAIFIYILGVLLLRLIIFAYAATFALIFNYLIKLLQI